MSVQQNNLKFWLRTIFSGIIGPVGQFVKTASCIFYRTKSNISLIILLIKIIFKFDVKSWSIVGSWWIRTIFNLTQIPWLNPFRKTAESNLIVTALFQSVRLPDHQQKVNQRKKTKKVSCGCFQAPNRNLSFPTIYKLLKNSIHSFTYL